MASGLKINLHKSNIIGIGIQSEEVEYAAGVLGCSMFSPPFVLFRVKVGGAMTRINSWNEVISKCPLGYLNGSSKLFPFEEYEAKQNDALVQSSILAGDVENLVEGDKVSNEVFVDSMIFSQEDPGTRLNPGSYKESPKEIHDDDDDEDDNDDHNNHALTRTRNTGSSEAPIQELTESNVLITDVPSKFTSSNNTHLHGIVARMSRHQGHMILNMRKTFVYKSNVRELLARVDKSLKEVVPKMMKYDPQSQAINSDLWNALRAKYEKSFASTDSCRHDAFCKCDHDNHLDDDALPEGGE
ncbi:hypothetical protein Tco_0998005 [Tanacetum coccineum]